MYILLFWDNYCDQKVKNKLFVVFFPCFCQKRRKKNVCEGSETDLFILSGLMCSGGPRNFHKGGANSEIFSFRLGGGVNPTQDLSFRI